MTIKLLIGWSILFIFLVSCENKPPPPEPPPTATFELVIQEKDPPSAGSCPDGMVPIQGNDQNFCLDVYEVTNGRYQACAKGGDCSSEPKEAETQTPPYWQEDSYYGNSAYSNHPVIQVSWHQANEYCEFMGKRLPTAEEWDKAADYAWPSLSQPDKPKAVGSLNDVSPEGVHDLAGNVREWIANSHEKSNKLIKGKSFYGIESEAEHYPPETQDWAIGFRCASDQP